MRYYLLLLGSVWLSLACPSPEAKRGAATPRAALDRVWEACRTPNAEHLWASSTEGLRQELNSRAAEIARNLSAQELHQLFPSFRGTSADFTGRVYLAGLLATGDSATNPCFGAEQWQLTDAQVEGGVHSFLLERPDGHDIALRFSQQGDHWLFNGFSKPVRREQPPTTRPCSWSGHYRFDLSWPKQPACELGNLPQQIEVYAEMDGDGSPRFLPLGKYRPTDALQGSRCELEFDGAPSGLPELRRLKLEFEERGTEVQASGLYSRLDPQEGAVTTGCSVVLTVKASRGPNP